jgi:hypothetical protein
MSDALILDVDGELIEIDEAFMDFSDLTPTEVAAINLLIGETKLGDPSPFSVAVFLFVKLARGREWGKPHFEAVVPLLTAWLNGQLVEAG